MGPYKQIVDEWLEEAPYATWDQINKCLALMQMPIILFPAASLSGAPKETRLGLTQSSKRNKIHI